MHTRITRRLLLTRSTAVFAGAALFSMGGCVTTVKDDVAWARRAADDPEMRERTCPVCGGATTTAASVADDTSRPSRNLELWNRSICGNLLYSSESPVCTECWYAYSPALRRWALSLKDAAGFRRRPLDPRISRFPLPSGQMEGRGVVYRQQFQRGGLFAEQLSFWCVTDDGYLATAGTYASGHSLSVAVERERLPGESYVVVSPRD